MAKTIPNGRIGWVRRLDTVLPKSAKRVFRQYGFAEDALIRGWREIAGEKLSRVAAPLRLTYGKEKGEKIAILHLLVEGAAALEVQHQIPILIEKINIFYGHNLISRITLIQGKPGQNKRPERVEKKPPDPAVVKQIETWTKAMKDSGLRETLISLGAEVLTKEQK
ncbi:MAG: DUF721 domain-containing protein [Proteobacteria bacterium]|nr:DUF721 domain-containing protein [Pseudomonadota bacterium]